MSRIAVVFVVMAMITAILVSTVRVTYAQNITTTPATNYTFITTPSIAGLNSTTILNAINAKIKLVYDGDDVSEGSNNHTNQSNKT